VGLAQLLPRFIAPHLLSVLLHCPRQLLIDQASKIPLRIYNMSCNVQEGLLSRWGKDGGTFGSRACPSVVRHNGVAHPHCGAVRVSRGRAEENSLKRSF